MTRLTIVAALAIVSATNVLPALAGSESAEHSHEMAGFSAGEPGDPKELSRIIKVTMEEHDGEMLYVPNFAKVSQSNS